jgi:hypothetical protein
MDPSESTHLKILPLTSNVTPTTTPQTSLTIPVFDLTSLKLDSHDDTTRVDQSTGHHGSNKLILYSQRWYYCLVPNPTLDSPKRTRVRRARALMDDYKLPQLDGKLVVVLTTPQGTRIYSLFDSYIEFSHYQQKFSPENRCFYEVIFGEFPQKPHFDIDIDKTDLDPPTVSGSTPGENPQTPIKDLDTVATQVCDALIKQLLTIFAERGIQLHLDRDLLMYTSHGPTKRSFHIIVNNYCHTNNEEAKKLYQRVLDGVSAELQYPQLHKWIDGAVYSPKQQFRIVGSQKFQSHRPKKFEFTWTYQGQAIQHRYLEKPESPTHEMILQLEESLVSYTSSCNILPSFSNSIPEDATETRINQFYQSADVSTDLAYRALQMCADKAGISIHDRRFPYAIRSVNGGIIALKRLKPSRCQICNKTHEHENPYIFIIESEGVKNVYFDCRRSPGKKLKVGVISDSITPVSPVMQTGLNWCSNVQQRLNQIAASPNAETKPVYLPLSQRPSDPKICSQLTRECL